MESYILKAWIKSIPTILIICLLILVGVLWYYNYYFYALILSILDVFLSIYQFLSDKRNEISTVNEKRREFEIIINNILSPEMKLLKPFELIKSSEKEEKWKKDLMNWATEKFSRNLSLSPKELIEESITKWIKIFPNGEISKVGIKDFIIYVFAKEIFFNDMIIRKLERKYSDFDSIYNDNKKRLFLWCYFNYYLHKRKNFGEFIDILELKQEDFRGAFNSLKGIKEYEDLFERFKSTFKDEQKKNRYLTALTEKFREYLQTSGISFEKFSEAFLYNLKNAYVIFRAEKSGYGKIRNSINKSNIPNTDLYFTAPHILFPKEDVRTAENLKKILVPNLTENDPHFLFIARLIPTDIKISSGSLTHNLRRMKEKVDFIGPLSKSINDYIRLLDELPKDFFESLSIDFLILSLKKGHKELLRRNENNLRKRIYRELKIEINNLTDYYKIKLSEIQKLTQILSEIGINQGIAKIYANEIFDGSRKWRYILYGYPPLTETGDQA